MATSSPKRRSTSAARKTSVAAAAGTTTEPNSPLSAQATDMPSSSAVDSPEPPLASEAAAKKPRQRAAARKAAQKSDQAAEVAEVLAPLVEEAAAKGPARKPRRKADEAAAPAAGADELASAAAPKRKRASKAAAAEAPMPLDTGEAVETAASAETSSVEPAVPAKSSKPARPRRGRAAKTDAPAAETPPLIPAEPPRYRLGSSEALEQGVFGDHELIDLLDGSRQQLRLLGREAWCCDCAAFAETGDCVHGPALLALLAADAAGAEALQAGWAAREGEVCLHPGPRRRLQWVAGQGLPVALRELAAEGLDEAQRIDAEHAHGWLQTLLNAARAHGVGLRVAPEVWPQLAWAQDARSRVQRLERWLADPQAARALLREPVAEHQWQAALFALAAGRAMLADDLGLGQREAALIAAQLSRQLFGLGSIAIVVADAARQAGWQRDIARLLGDWPEGLLLAEALPAGRGAPELLIVDGVDALGDEALAALQAVPAAQLLLIADREPLGDARLPAWVAWLDSARRGPLAALLGLPADAGKRAQREALETVLLSRRKRELLDSLPPMLLQTRWLDTSAASANPGQRAAVQTLRDAMQRWQAHGFLGSAERQQLLQALQQLPPAGRHVLKAKAEALQALCSEWLAPAGAASRLLVCAQSETLLDGLEQALRLRKLPVQRLRAGMDAAERAALLTSWRSEAQALLLASDAALDDLDDELDEPRLGLVHADLPWDAQQLQARLSLAAGSAARGVPAALLLVEGSTDRALLAVQQQQAGAAMPAWLAAPPAWLRDEELEALMAGLASLLAALAA